MNQFKEMRMKDIKVGVYYFPNYHIDPINEAHHGKGWTEWDITKYATPRFEGHVQPKAPAWGYEDEADPKVMAKKIDAAADHGVDVFLFDWYYYNDGPFLHRALQEGFFGAENNERLEFAIMWANHNWVNIHPAARIVEPAVLMPGAVSYDTFMEIARLTVDEYFARPNYMKVDGGLYYSIYEPDKLVTGLGGYDAVCSAFDEFREMTRKKGLGEINLNGVTWGVQILPGESSGDIDALAKKIGLDSISQYVWIHNEMPPLFPETEYAPYMENAFDLMKETDKKVNIPFYPNVTMGWDSSPRTVQSDVYDEQGYPFVGILKNNTPDAFEKALRRMKEWLSGRGRAKMFSINAWNEWTEGSYLEPDTVNGMGYLEAIKRVFGE